MARNENLGLDFQHTRDGRSMARVAVVLACGYTRDGGAPTLTEECSSHPEFEKEVGRLREELDLLLDESRVHFGETPRSREAPSPPPVEERPPSTEQLRSMHPSELLVKDLMTRDVRTVSPDDKLSVADELMKVGKFRHVVVVNEWGAITGVVSHRDLFYGALGWTMGEGAHARGRVLESRKAKDVMATRVVTIAPDAYLAEAARIMLSEQIGCLPVVERDELVGILTEGDFLALLSAR